jgi:formate dehydrogenase major subunit
MGGTQHSVGSANVRAYCTLGLAHGTIGTAGGGCNIYRGHCNVQGATDMGVEPITLPAYYGLVEPAWRHWSRVWGVDYDYMLGRFADKKMMEGPGIPESRWHDAVLEKKENVEQQDNLRAMVFWGHGANTQTRGPDAKRAMDKIDMVVVVDPHPIQVAAMSDRKDGIYLLPACSALEQDGSRTASNRSLQWGYKIVEPIFESKTDLDIMYMFAKKFGFAEQMFKNVKVDNGKVLAEDVLRELNAGSLTIGYSGQSPERLKLHMANQKDFDTKTLKAASGPCAGETYGLPWPCWGKPEHKHPGTHVLYDTSKPVREGGLNFRALFVEDPDKVSLLAEGSYPVGAELQDGHPQFTYGMLKKLGWDKDLTTEERETIERIGGANPDAVPWSLDLSAGIIRVAILHGNAPFGNGKARAKVWNFPDPVATHREPLYAPNRELVAKYPTYTDRKGGRLPILYKSIQDVDFSKDYPTVLTSGRLVEYEGGGDETRSNKWLAELQQEMFIEVHPTDATAKGIKNWDWVWVYSPNGKDVRLKVRAMLTERVGKGVAWMPFHFAGHWMGEDRRSRYPQGTDPIVLGEAANTALTYGYDPVTQMQETKTSLCRIEKA